MRLALRVVAGEYWVRQLLVLVAAAFAFGLPYLLLHPAASVAVAHGRELASVESSLGLGWERWFQSAAGGFGLAGVFAWLYYGSQFFVMWGALVVLCMTFRPAYELLRNLIVAGSLCSIAVFWLWPVAPPRAAGDSIRALAIPAVAPVRYDVFAAMPSLHTACALAVSLALCSLTSRWWLRCLALSWTVLVVVTILATGNHYVLDAVAGSVLTLALYALERRRLAWSSPARFRAGQAAAQEGELLCR